VFKGFRINADDAGLDQDIDIAILELLKKGAVNTCSVAPNGDNFDNFINEFKSMQFKSIGIHLCFTGDENALTGRSILTNQEGKFLFKNKLIWRSIYSPRKTLKALEQELNTQIEKIRDCNLLISHFDSHQHLHLFPLLSRLVIKLVKEHDSSLRVPIIIKPTARLSSFLIMPLSFFLKIRAKKSGIKIHRSIGFEYSGRITEKTLTYYSTHLQHKFDELLVHPGYSTDALIRKYKNWNYEWDNERVALLNLNPGNGCTNEK
jgi:predicted glycoside hydrolase/deacetylase ChbG (UPF0249 family)